VGTVSTYAGEREYFPGLSADEVAGIKIVGTPVGFSLENILKLNPDLILSLDSSEQIYKQLSAIAPTVVREYEKIKVSFKENFRAIAQLVDRQEKAEEVLTQYQNRIRTMQKLLKAQSKQPEISVINYYGGNFLIPASYAPFFQVLSDLEVRIKPLFLKYNEYLPFSIEAISEYDADILFIVDFDDKPASFFFQNPLISSLKSVKNNHAYLVRADVWWAYGPLGINRLLDEFSKYLLKS
jgi:iron complex transport system substrate-binding protein